LFLVDYDARQNDSGDGDYNDSVDQLLVSMMMMMMMKEAEMMK
jgi:hypothetical protein